MCHVTPSCYSWHQTDLVKSSLVPQHCHQWSSVKRSSGISQNCVLNRQYCTPHIYICILFMLLQASQAEDHLNDCPDLHCCVSNHFMYRYHAQFHLSTSLFCMCKEKWDQIHNSYSTAWIKCWDNTLLVLDWIACKVWYCDTLCKMHC